MLGRPVYAITCHRFKPWSSLNQLINHDSVSVLSEWHAAPTYDNKTAMLYQFIMDCRGSIGAVVPSLQVWR